MSRAAGTVLAALASAGFYLLLIDTASPPELYAGAGVVLLAVGAYVAARDPRAGPAVGPGELGVGALRALLRAPEQIGQALWVAACQLRNPQPARGRFVTIALDPADDAALDSGHRALAEMLGSLTPNTIVLGVDHSRRVMLVHQLHQHPLERDITGAQR